MRWSNPTQGGDGRKEKSEKTEKKPLQRSLIKFTGVKFFILLKLWMTVPVIWRPVTDALEISLWKFIHSPRAFFAFFFCERYTWKIVVWLLSRSQSKSVTVLMCVVYANKYPQTATVHNEFRFEPFNERFIWFVRKKYLRNNTLLCPIVCITAELIQKITQITVLKKKKIEEKPHVWWKLRMRFPVDL